VLAKPGPIAAMPSPKDETTQSPAPSRNGYFVIHASATWTGVDAELNGVMEDLTTGEKQVFGSAADVSRLMRDWAARELDDAAPRRSAPDRGK
jgi:hypothetical protein